MQNRTIAILESRSGKQIGELVSKYGATPFLAPALAEKPDVDPKQIASMVEDWSHDLPDLFIFQTGVGTKALFATTDQLNLTEKLVALMARSKVLVRGPKPKGALRSKGVHIDMVAGDPYTTTELLAHVETLALSGKRVVVQRYGDTNIALQTALEARGARVSEVATYRWSLPEDTQPLINLIDRLAEKTIDMVCFTSASQVYNFFKVADDVNRAAGLKAGLNQTHIASIGPVCSAALRQYDIRVDVEPSPPKLGPYMAAINEWFA